MNKYKKRIFIVMTAMALSTGLIGCNKKNSDSTTQESVNITTTEATAEAITETTEQAIASISDSIATTDSTEAIFVDNLATGPSIPYEEPIGVADPNVDYDLTVLTTNMIYVELTNMITDESYIGKTIKVKGHYKPVFYEPTGKYYHYVMIHDETGCCENGIEFIWDDNSHIYPDEYPEADQEILIQGVYGSYVEENITYFYIGVDDVIISE